MSMIELYSSGGHRNILLADSSHGEAVQANQHLIVHEGKGMILDPGGHKVYTKVMSDTGALLPLSGLQYVFLSHQDPDIVASVNGWLMTTDATAYASALWKRFIPHFGLDHLVADRLAEIPDEGMRLNLNGVDLYVVPAHFMHSCGNFQIYDPVSKILYSGDLGASVDCDYRETQDFESHRPKMQGFHERYMGGNAILRAWAQMVEALDIETIAPQHGAMIRGKPAVNAFISWCRELRCGPDLMAPQMRFPS